MDKKRNSTVQIDHALHTIHPTRGFLFGALILGALLAFELFNYSTTDFALTDLLGNLQFLDVRWATILALAFCGIDFAGIARLFTPERQPTNTGEAGLASLFTPERPPTIAGEAGLARLFTPQKGAGQPKEVWYLFGAWLLAATMNAMLTWWGVAIAILSHASQGSSVIPPQTMLDVVPIFVAIMVWVIRVLIIGSFAVAGDRMFTQAEMAYQLPHPTQSQPSSSPSLPAPVATLHPAPKSDPGPVNAGLSRADPTYHPVSMSGSSHNPHEVRK